MIENNMRANAALFVHAFQNIAHSRLLLFYYRLSSSKIARRASYVLRSLTQTPDFVSKFFAVRGSGLQCYHLGFNDVVLFVLRMELDFPRIRSVN